VTNNPCHSERNVAKRNAVEAVTQPTKSARPGFPSLTVFVGGPRDSERSLDFARDDKKRATHAQLK
jgi:hypothetical protein